MRDLNAPIHGAYLFAHPDYYAVTTYKKLEKSDYYYSILSSELREVHHTVVRKVPWTYISFFGYPRDDAGWKIHISASLENHIEVLKCVSSYLFHRRIDFKFASNEDEFTDLNSKTISRASSGKFIVIYPKQSAFAEIIEELYVLLKGFDGPYILSDLPYKDSKVLFYRYGEFSPITIRDEYGTISTYILDDKNELYVDERVPKYKTPGWAKQPFEVSQESVPSILLSKYRINEAINFSAQGGVYTSTHDGIKVAIKEARAYCGIDKNKSYATERMKHEYQVLCALKELNVTPRPIELIEDCGNTYLVEEFLPGTSLRPYPVDNSPLIHTVINDPIGRAKKEKLFYQELRVIATKALVAIEKIHSAGYTVGDISPANIMYDRDTQKLHFIDLEVATELCKVTEKSTFGLRTPGFWAKEGLPPAQGDLYKIGLVILYCIMPYDGLWSLSESKAFELIEIYRQNKTVPDDILGIIHQLLTSRFDNAGEALREIERNQFYLPKADKYFLSTNGCRKEDIQRIANEFYRNVKFYLTDDLYPLGNDPMGQLTGGFSYGYGIFGFLYAVKKSKLGVQLPDRDFLEEIVHRFMYKFRSNPNDIAPGLYVGLSGIAYCLTHLGFDSEAKYVLAQACKAECTMSDYSYGKAGRLLVLLYFYRKYGDKRYLTEAIRNAESIMKESIEKEGNIYWKDIAGDIYSGLTRGNAGIAYALLVLYKITKNKKFLHFGIRALDGDIKRIKTVREDGLIGFNSRPLESRSKVYSPYAHNGLTGLGSVLIRYFLVTDDSAYLDITEKIISSCKCQYLLHTGYLTGICGIISFLQDVKYTLHRDDVENFMKDMFSCLRFHYVETECSVGYFGDQGYKLSHDLLTGSAGVFLTYSRNICKQKSNHFMILDELFYC